MWDSLPWFVRLAIELVAGAIVLAAGVVFLWVVFWILALVFKALGGVLSVIFGPLIRLMDRLSARRKARPSRIRVGRFALRREQRKRRDLGYEK
jgi:hypothetical protein